MLRGISPCFWRAPTDNDKGGEEKCYCSEGQKIANQALQTQREYLDYQGIAMKIRISKLSNFHQCKMPSLDSLTRHAIPLFS
ncbi:glycoside hydrolase family 2 protein [Tanacetum coccineum]